MSLLFPVASFAELRARLTSPTRFDEAAAEGARRRQAELTKPPGSLARLEDLAVFMAGWRETAIPRIDKAQIAVFAGDHGIYAQGVAPYPQEVTAQMVANFRSGGAAICQLARVAGAELDVLDVGVERPTRDFTEAPAMTEAETLTAMAQGAAALDPDADVAIFGEMGIGNSTVAAAMALALFGGEAQDWVGPGTGAHGATLARKLAVVARGVAARQADFGTPADPLRVLAALGGREQAAICGAILEARTRRIPVILDGFICTASAAALFALDPRWLDHALAGHLGAEPGHRPLLERFGKAPILSLGMRLGEGTGAALALSVLRGALACHGGMASFAEAGVSGENP